MVDQPEGEQSAGPAVVLLNEFEGRLPIMRDQIRRLRELTERSNVTVQIIPLRRSAHLGGGGAFTILGYEGGGATGYRRFLASSLITNDR